MALAAFTRPAFAARHHWRAREGNTPTGGFTSSSCCGAGMLSPYSFRLREASEIAEHRQPSLELRPHLFGLLQVQSDPQSDSLFARDGAGFPQDAAKNGKNWAVGSPKVQLVNLLWLPSLPLCEVLRGSVEVQS